MENVRFGGLDPLDLHTCQHCQHARHDIGRGKVCAKSWLPIAPMDYISVNDCEDYTSSYLTDYRRRPDMERRIK